MKNQKLHRAFHIDRYNRFKCWALYVRIPLSPKLINPIPHTIGRDETERSIERRDELIKLTAGCTHQRPQSIAETQLTNLLLEIAGMEIDTIPGMISNWNGGTEKNQSSQLTMASTLLPGGLAWNCISIVITIERERQLLPPQTLIRFGWRRSLILWSEIKLHSLEQSSLTSDLISVRGVIAIRTSSGERHRSRHQSKDMSPIAFHLSWAQFGPLPVHNKFSRLLVVRTIFPA